MKAPYKAIEFILEQAPKFAAAKAQRVYLEEFRKTKKALTVFFTYLIICAGNWIESRAGEKKRQAEKKRDDAHRNYRV